MPTYNFQVNGRPVSVESRDPAQPLLYLLRNALSLRPVPHREEAGRRGRIRVRVHTVMEGTL